MTKITIKEAFPHDWVTREAGEKLRKMIMASLEKGEEIDLDFSNMTIASVSFFDEALAKLKEEKDLPKNWDKLLKVANLNKLDLEVLNVVCKERKIIIPLSEDSKKSHPWRVCPIGQHYVKEHDKKTKTGKVGHWHEQCRKNPSGKEIYTTDEIHEIAKHFSSHPLTLPSLFTTEEWNNFDLMIAGWTRFWNDTFNPVDKLPPNYVKALIASESSFNIDALAANKKKGVGSAQGLVQLTEETAKLISPDNKELSDHQFDLNKGDIFDPMINVCVAVRWLFRKRVIAQSRLKRLPTWYEVLQEYKGILLDKSPRAEKERGIILARLRDLGEKI